MVYIQNVLTRRLYLIAIFTFVVLVCESAEAGTTKFAYKKPIFGKANIFKEKRLRAANLALPRTYYATTRATTTTTTTTTPAPITTTTTTTTTSTTQAPILQSASILPSESGSNESDHPVMVENVNSGHNDEHHSEDQQDVLQITVETKSNNNNGNINQQTATEIETNKSTATLQAENQSPSITEVELVKASEEDEHEHEHDEELVDTTLEVSVEMEEPPQILGLPSNSEMINIAIETVPAKKIMAIKTTTEMQPQTESNLPVPCTCGIFMTSQIKRGIPQSRPVILNELDRPFACNPIGQKQCQTKCLETIVQHLPNSASILCATLDRDCRKERAYLFIKNCRNFWINTHLAAGREYCCKNGQPYQCPLM